MGVFPTSQPDLDRPAPPHTTSTASMKGQKTGSGVNRNSTDSSFDSINQAQILEVIFLYVTARSGFSPVNLPTTDVPTFASLEEARSTFERSGQKFKAGDGYIKSFGQRYSVHYEFRSGTLTLVTLTLNKN